MTSKAGEKKLIFFSHASDDKEIVLRLQAFVDRVFLQYFDSFNSSSLSSIYAGDPWRKEVRTNLERADIVLVLLTPASIARPWVMYEAGACWFATETRDKTLIPCLYDVDSNQVPSVMTENQAVNLRDRLSVIRLVESLKQWVIFTPKEEDVQKEITDYLDDEARHLYPQDRIPTAESRKAVTDLLTALGRLYQGNTGERRQPADIARYLLDEKVIDADQYNLFTRVLMA